MRCGSLRGEPQLEGGAFAHFAGRFNPAVVLIDNAVNGRKPQAGPLPHFLRSEERLKTTAQCFGLHAAAGVSDGEANVDGAAQPLAAGDVVYVPFGSVLAIVNHSSDKTLRYLIIKAANTAHAPHPTVDP